MDDSELEWEKRGPVGLGPFWSEISRPASNKLRQVLIISRVAALDFASLSKWKRDSYTRISVGKKERQDKQSFDGNSFVSRGTIRLFRHYPSLQLSFTFSFCHLGKGHKKMKIEEVHCLFPLYSETVFKQSPPNDSAHLPSLQSIQYLTTKMS